MGDLLQLPPVLEKKYLDYEKTQINPRWELYDKKY
jgi:hypothetical protein